MPFTGGAHMRIPALRIRALYGSVRFFPLDIGCLLISAIKKRKANSGAHSKMGPKMELG